MAPTVETSVLDRILDPVGRALTPEVARKLVDLRVDAKTQARIDRLARRANEGKLTAEERNWLQTTLDAEQRHRESIHKISWKQALLNWKVISLGIVYMGITVPLYGLGFFLPQIIKGFGGLSNVEIGFINAFPYLVGAIAMVFWTRWSDARRERKVFLSDPVAVRRRAVWSAMRCASRT